MGILQLAAAGSVQRFAGEGFHPLYCLHCNRLIFLVQAAVNICSVRCLPRRPRRPLLGVDPVPVLCVQPPPQLIDIPAGGLVPGQVLLWVIAGHGGAAVKPHGVLAVAVGVDVLGMAVFQRRLAGPLPAPACQHHAEGAAVPVGNPGELGPVPDGVFQGGVRRRLLHQTAHAPLQKGRALPGAVHHPGRLADVGRGGRFRRRKLDAGGHGHGVVHLTGQLGAALPVFLHQGLGIVDQGVGIPGAVPGYVLGHLLPGLLIQPGQTADVFLPALSCDLHSPPLPAAAGPAPAVPGP